jgi:hypothetical protein
MFVTKIIIRFTSYNINDLIMLALIGLTNVLEREIITLSVILIKKNRHTIFLTQFISIRYCLSKHVGN